MTRNLIPSHSIAMWLLNIIDRFLDLLGLSRYQTLEEIIYFAIILAASFAIGWIIRKVTLMTTKKLVKMHNTEFGNELLEQHTLTKCSHIIPPLVFLGLVPFAFESSASIHNIIISCALIYTLIMLGIGLSAVLTFVFSRFNSRENTKNLPIRGILNIAVGIVWGVVVIVCVSILVHKSPAALLGGMTAFAAVIMLIFKDSILGFVAGIQMSQNDMVRVGDWIVVPSTLANGTVEDVSLTTVKVRNFDNTLVMVPPYTLVSGSFQNWRGMSETGVRRVCQSIYINPDSIKAATTEMIASIGAKYPSVKAFADKLQSAGHSIAWNAGNAPLNGTTETNLGLFRAYLVSYLLASEMVDKTRDLMVAIQPMSAEGVPLQLYFFSIINQWEAYEGVRSAVMEHALLSSADFGLEILSADHLSVDTVSLKTPALTADTTSTPAPSAATPTNA